MKDLMGKISLKKVDRGNMAALSNPTRSDSFGPLSEVGYIFRSVWCHLKTT